jgi:ribose 5-phosphate isomerase A
MSTDQTLLKIAEHALTFLQDGMVVGLGTGRAATAFIHELGKRAAAGLKVSGVPTSQATAGLAKQLGIPLTGLEDVEQLDLTVDGADEVEPKTLFLIKGLGGALVREKIVAAASKRLVILVGAEKLVGALGEHGTLPVEVVPFALGLCRRRLTALGCPPATRQVGGRTFVSDNGNYVLDCKVSALRDPEALEQSIRAIPGVVGTGLFLGMADTVLVQDGDRVQVLQRNRP